jgi:N4-(beta-N-acetylglucosaminyl)-L-asparaginase
MVRAMTRREFVKVGAAAAAVGPGPTPTQGTTVVTPKSFKPVVIGSANGNTYKNGGPRTAVHEAFERTVKGEDLLDALIAGVNLNELDPEDQDVGFGGLPNADGVVQLDACCMHGPKKRAGGVAAIEGVRTPSLVARAVMDQTDHHLLVGQGAQDFARQIGFTIEADLNTPKSRKLWLEWKRRIDPRYWLDPEKRGAAAMAAVREMAAEGLIDPSHVFGTINCNGVSPKGEICGVTTTSGLSFKIPGRVGDSPILGAGLYVDGEVGAAGSTGRGEANLYGLCSFLIVDEMRRGRGPKDAAMEALRRVKAATVEKRLLNEQGNPDFDVKFFAVNRRGEFAGVGLYAKLSGKQQTFAVCTENGPETLPLEGLLEDGPGL